MKDRQRERESHIQRLRQRHSDRDIERQTQSLRHIDCDTVTDKRDRDWATVTETGIKTCTVTETELVLMESVQCYFSVLFSTL